MLAGGQFSKSRKHAVWLPSFLERYDPDTLRYYLSMNMPENHDTDFNWPDFVEKVNSELIAAYGNFVHRMLTLGERLPKEAGASPFEAHDAHPCCRPHQQHLEGALDTITQSLQRHRYKRGATRHHQRGYIRKSNPASSGSVETFERTPRRSRRKSRRSGLCWRISRFLAVTTQPFLPFSAQRLWTNLGLEGEVADVPWSEAINWEAALGWASQSPTPLFERLDLDEILQVEQGLVEDDEQESSVHGVKGGKKKEERR